MNLKCNAQYGFTEEAYLKMYNHALIEGDFMHHYMLDQTKVIKKLQSMEIYICL